jgi:hypothetical protein
MEGGRDGLTIIYLAGLKNHDQIQSRSIPASKGLNERGLKEATPDLSVILTLSHSTIQPTSPLGWQLY